MASKSKAKSRATFSRQRNAAKKALAANKYIVAINNFSKALSFKNISSTEKVEMLEGRASAYKAINNIVEMATDIEELAALQKAVISQSQAELDILDSIAEALKDQQDLDSIGKIVGAKVQQFFNAEIAGVALYDGKSGLIKPPYYYDRGTLVDVPAFEFGEGVTSNVIKSGKPLIIGTAAESIKYGSIFNDELPSESSLYAPILAGKNVIGVLTIQDSKKKAFNQHQLNLLVSIASNMAVALENARLFEETSKRNAELAVINSIQEALAQELELNSIYRIVGEKVLEIFKADTVVINSLDKEKHEINRLFAYEKGEVFEPFTVRLSEDQFSKIYQSDSILVNQDFEEYAEENNIQIVEGLVPKSYLVATIKIKGFVVGSISIQNMEMEYAYSESDVSLLETIGNSMGVALENARLFDAIQQSNLEITAALEQQNATGEVLNALANSPTDIQPVLDAVAENAARLCEADDVQIYKVAGDRLPEVAHFGPLPALDSGESLPLTRGLLTGRAVLDKKPVHIEDFLKISKKEFPESVALQKRLGHRTSLSMPLLKEGNAIGAVVVRRNEVKPFSEKQIALLSTFADQAAIAMENVRLFEETQQRNAELAVINSVQEALAQELDLQDIYRTMGKKVLEIFNAQTFVLNSYDLDTNQTSYDFVLEKGEEYPPYSREMRPDELAVILSNQPLVLNEGFAAYAKKNKIKIEVGAAPKSVLVVPFSKKGNRKGAISIQDMDREFAYSDSDVRLLETITHSMVAAIENARLFDDSAQRNAELAIINSVGEAMSSNLDVDTVTKIVGDKVLEIFKADVVFIALADAQNKYFEFAFLGGRDGHFEADPAPISEGLSSVIFKEKKARLFASEEEQKEAGAYTITGEEIEGNELITHSWMGVPIIVGKKAIGVVSVQNVLPNAFTQNDLNLLSTLATNMGVAIENARLFDETAQRNAELAIINSVGDAMSSNLDVNTVTEIVGDKVVEIFKADAAFIALVDIQLNMLDFAYLFDDGKRYDGISGIISEGLSPTILKEGKALLFGTEQEQVEAGAINITGEGIDPDSPVSQSFMGVPIIVGKKVIGIVSVQNYAQNDFSPNDLNLLSTLATNMGVAIENARLFDETTQRNAELAVINSVQAALADELDIQTIYNIVGDKLRAIFEIDAVAISASNLNSGLTTSFYDYEDGQYLPHISYETGNWRRKLIDVGKSVLINEGIDELSAELKEEAPQGRLPKSIITVPLPKRDDTILTVDLMDMDNEHAFSDSDVQLLETIATSMSAALDSARLFAETTERNAELAVITSVQDALAQELDIQGIYEVVGEKIKDIFDAQVVIFAYYDHEVRIRHFNYFFEKGERLFPEPSPFNDFTNYQIEHRRTLVINENIREQGKKYGLTLSAGDWAKSGVWSVINIGKKVIGSISIQNMDKENAFTENDVRLLETIAGSMSAALDNARLFSETTERNAELDIINSVGEAMSRNLDVDTVAEIVGDKVQEIFKADSVSILLANEAEQEFHFAYDYFDGDKFQPDPSAIDTGLSAEIFKSGKPLLFGTTEEAISAGAISIEGEGIDPDEQDTQSFLGVPIVIGDKTIGVVNVQSKTQNAYGDNDVSLLSTLATNMGVAIENARLFDEAGQRNLELDIINSVGEAMSRNLDVGTVTEIVGEKVREIFLADIVFIALIDKSGKLLEFPYLNDRGTRIENIDPKLLGEQGLSEKIIKNREPLVFGTEKDMFDAGAQKFTGEDIDENWTQPKSWMGVPIIVGTKVIGVASVMKYPEHAFAESDVALLSTLATNMGVAIENARLFDESTQRNAELDIINSVGEAMSRNLDVETVTRIVGDKVFEIFKADSVFITLVDWEKEIFEFAYDNDRGTINTPDSVPIGKGLSAKILKTLKPLVFANAEEQKKAGAVVITGEDIDPENAWTESWMGVPIVVGKKAIGIASVQNYKQNAFDENDLNLLLILAANMGVAIENARLFDESNRLLIESNKKQDELATINTVGEALASELELGALIELIGEQVSKIFNADIAYLALLNPDTSMINFPYIQGEDLAPMKLGEGIVSQIIENNKGVLINQDEDWQQTEQKILRVGVKAKSYLGVPIFFGKKAIGAISVQSTKSANQFSEADMNLLSTIASNVGVFLRNVQLFQDSEDRAEEMSTLTELGLEISQELDLDVLLNKIAEKALMSLDGQDVVIRSLEADGSMPAIAAVGERAEILGSHISHIDNVSISGSVIKNAQAEFVNYPEKDPRTESIPGIETAAIGPGVYAPLLSKIGPIGVLGVFRYSANQKHFTEPDLHFAEGLARQATSAIENARLFGEIERQKKYFETFFEYSPAAVVVVDYEGIVVSWSPAAEKLFGYSSQEAVGKDVDSLVANNSLVIEEAETYTQKFTEKRADNIEFIGKRTRKDGSLVDVEVKGLPISVEGEKNIYLVIYHDVSAIEEARRAAEEANHAKSAFLANMSHELRTPLNAIIGFSRIVKRKSTDLLPEKQIENLDKVLVSAAHLLDLINTVLDIAKIEAGRMELQISDFDLLSLIDGSIATTQPLLGSSQVKFGKLGVSEIPPMHSDQEKIRRILLNLLSNAAKFTHQGSIKVRTTLKGDLVTVAVKDTGIGIAEDNLRKIFDEFQQADNTTTREYGGTGLGLSISRSLAQLLGGDLFVSSKEGEGSTFSFTIPLHLGAAEKEKEISAAELEVVEVDNDTSKPLVLVIDDQPDVYNIMQQNLEEAGYRVAAALSGKEGLEKARKLKPFAITLDIMMPRKDGWQVLHDLKNDPLTKDIPVIMLTIVDNKAMGLRLGAADYLVKPLNEDLVIAALERVAKNNGGEMAKQLLLVDDDEKVHDLIKQMFADQSLNIEIAKNGKLALQKTAKSVPDVILLDLLMPVMDGFQFIEKIKENEAFQNIPIIVLTAKSLTNSEQAQLQKSVSSIVQKQALTSDSLIEQIKKIVA
jgi:PAS domain S-box-containing protein